MENPYSHAPAPGSLTPEQQKVADYELAIGRNASYYLPKFESYDAGGSTVGWNWPAFLVPSAWCFYRKMFLWGFLNLFFPFITLMLVGLVSALLNMPPLLTGALVIGALLIEWVLLAVFANALYWQHISGLIRNVPRSLADKPDRRTRRIERDGGTSIGAMIAIMGVGVFFGGGILAAISIPAYQDYTIRAQVAEGLSLAASAKASVAEYYAQNKDWPSDASTTGVQPIHGNYVKSVTVANGSVVITYGGRANSQLVDQRLILIPGAREDGSIVWTCGEKAVPEGVDLAPGPQGADMPPKYLPSDCRP